MISHFELLKDLDYLGHFVIKSLSFNNYMKLDAAAIKALNLLPNPSENSNLRSSSGNNKCITSLFDVLNNTFTKSIGERLLKQWIRQPLKNKDEIIKRQKLVSIFVNDSILRDAVINSCLKSTPDLTLLSRKLERQTNIKVQDLYSLYMFCSKLSTLKV